MNISTDDIAIFIKYPHIFGHYLGYDRLKQIHSEWIKLAWLSPVESLQAHRNSYKTTSVLIVGSIWYLLFFNSNATILFIRKKEGDTSKVIRTLRSFFESPEILAITSSFHGTNSLKTDNWSTQGITISLKKNKPPEGNIEGAGIGGAITGSHYDFIMPDDIITLEDRVSRASREWTKEFIRELTNMKSPIGKIFFSGTPWHKDDGWTIIPEPIKYPIGTVPIDGFMSDQLPGKITELRSGLTTSLYSANYELKHVADENRIFPDPIFGEWPDSVRPQAWLDTKYSGTHTNALTMIGKHDGKWYCRGWIWPQHVVDIYPQIVEKLNQYRNGTLYVETNADQGAAVRDLGKLYPSVSGRREHHNKHNKIISFGKQNLRKLIFATDCQLEYLNQILDY